ncbi:MAG: hypothetical protein JJ863_10750 [Deltaproteobacteria bacterium]|nr:hypothetical protein [Deltaproteobacteria bacterium]
MSRSVFTLALLGCFAVGGALRAHDLEGALVWHDEVFTQVFAAGHGASDWLPLFDGEVRPITELREARVLDPDRSALDTAIGLARDEPQHPPLYYAAARAFGSVVTAPDVTGAAKKLRWLSWLCSLLAIAAMGWCAREVFGGRRSAVDDRKSGVGDRKPVVGDRSSASASESESASVLRPRVLAAVALFAVSPFHVLYAQEAREYALWTAFVLASTAALLRARRVASLGSWLLYAILQVIGFYTSFAMLTVAVAHALFVGVRDLPRVRADANVRRSFVHAFGAWLLGAVLFLPWALLLLEHWEAFRASMAWSRDIAIPRSEVLATFGLNLTRPFVELGADELSLGVAVVGCFVLTTLAAGLTTLRRRPEALALVVALFVAPLFFYLVPDLVGGGIRSLSARYLIPSLLALQLAAAAMVPTEVDSLTRADRRVRTFALAALLMLGVFGSVRAARSPAPWTKGISRPLPAIAAALEPYPGALVVVDHERHHPGTILTLSGMLADTTQVQLLPTVEDYELADHPGPVFLLDVSPRFRDELRASAGVTITPVSEHLHATLYRVQRR